MDGNKVFIGVDISQDSLDMAAYPTGQVWQYKNSKGGITKAIAKLKGLELKLIVMEATGGWRGFYVKRYIRPVYQQR